MEFVLLGTGNKKGTTDQRIEDDGERAEMGKN